MNEDEDEDEDGLQMEWGGQEDMNGSKPIRNLSQEAGFSLSPVRGIGAAWKPDTARHLSFGSAWTERSSKKRDGGDDAMRDSIAQVSTSNATEFSFEFDLRASGGSSTSHRGRRTGEANSRGRSDVIGSITPVKETRSKGARGSRSRL